jgi:hypothetical protein
MISILPGIRYHLKPKILEPTCNIEPTSADVSAIYAARVFRGSVFSVQYERALPTDKQSLSVPPLTTKALYFGATVNRKVVRALPPHGQGKLVRATLLVPVQFLLPALCASLFSPS